MTKYNISHPDQLRKIILLRGFTSILAWCIIPNTRR